MATMSEKFIKYMVKDHPGELKEFIQNYPKNKTFTIEYQTFKKYDEYLIELFEKMPEEILYTIKQTLIKKMELSEEDNIYFNIIHYDNTVELSDISSEHIGKLIKFNAYVKKVYDVHPTLHEAYFECMDCMKLITIQQFSHSNIIRPKRCTECGGYSFRLSEDMNKYHDSQRIDVSSWDTNQELSIILRNDLCSWDDYQVNDEISILGIVKTFKPSENAPFEKYIEVVHINVVDKSDEDIIVYDDLEDVRNTSEYNDWVDKVIRDSGNVCACCGGDKYLHAHHIFSYADYPDLRLDPENGIALCKWCHGKYNSYFGHKGTARNLVEFLNRFGVVKK